MTYHHTDAPEMGCAWDCNPDIEWIDEPYDLDLDETMDETDWQVLVLDRFGDRTVNPCIEGLSLAQEQRPEDWI